MNRVAISDNLDQLSSESRLVGNWNLTVRYGIPNYQTAMAGRQTVAEPRRAFRPAKLKTYESILRKDVMRLH